MLSINIPEMYVCNNQARQLPGDLHLAHGIELRNVKPLFSDRDRAKGSVRNLPQQAPTFFNNPTFLYILSRNRKSASIVLHGVDCCGM